ncbi:hypothetical protein C8046_05770 [Serinibacter arcticus]|uniref:ABC transporter domain-containing protein n=1 Tax=Serinibacter arcticus TaxID=1655435 RepID=A0A2U1ZTD6_9MICO|nr:ABC transporter ATP-binding protein [Serinibacter arcticus]PWD50244.1 hypothetical protein C8046_05770 [Serinibacter arcticus]
MRAAAAGVAFIVRRIWRVSPLRVLSSVTVTLLLAFVPALQVYALAQLVERLDGDAGFADVAPPLLLVVAVIGLGGPVRSVATTLRTEAEHGVAAALTGDVMHRAAHTSPSDLARPETTAELQKQQEIATEASRSLFGGLVSGAEGVISTAAIVVAVATFSRLAGLLTVLALIPALVAGRLLARVWSRYWDAAGPPFGRVRYLGNLLVRQRSAVELATLGAGPSVADDAAQRWDEIRALRVALSRRELRSDWLVGAVTTVFVLGALAALLTDTGYSPVAVAGITGITAGAAAVGMAGVHLGRLLSTGPQAAQLRDFLASATPAADTGRAAPTQIDHLRVSGLTHTYPGRDSPAVTGVSVEARRGEVIALVGANGAGKTTALRGLLGLLEVDRGTVTLDGVAPTDVGTSAWLQRFGTLVQEFERYEFSIRRNLLLGAEGRTVADEELWSALELAGLAAFVRGLPDGLDAMLGEQWGGTALSGGQWQRLSLARVAVRNAPVWVLDEATAAVDAESEEAILGRLVADRARRITILVSHRAWTLRDVDRIYVLDDGVVLEQGRFEDLLARGGHFARLFRHQLGEHGLEGS